jgi:hypothetical protein
MANKKNLPKLSKRTANLEAWLDEVTKKHNYVAKEVEYAHSDLALVRGRLDKIEKHEEKTDKSIEEMRGIINAVNKKAGLLTNVAAKNAGKVKTAEQGATGKPDTSNTIAALTSSMNIIATSLGIMNSSLSKALGVKMAPMGAQKEEAPGPSGIPAPKEGEKEQGIFGLLKGLFSNPAVVAAIAGIVYTVLPKETQEQIKGFLGGFADGLGEAMGKNEQEGMGGFNTALKAAGIALTAYFGAKMISGVAGAITTTLKIVKMMGGGKLGRGLAVAGAAAAVGGAVAMSGGDDEEGGGGEAAAAGGAVPSGGDAGGAESKPSPAGTSLPKPKDTTAPKAPPGSSSTGSNVPDNIDLKSVVNAGSGVDLEGLDPSAKKRLAGMAYEYQQKTGKKLQVNSAYRDPEKQAQLYAKIGPPNAAPPGKSWHEKGLAFDINSADANKADELGLMAKYGFKRPVAKEPWHVELSETRGGPAYADNPAAPGAAVAVADKSGKPSIPASGKTTAAGEVASAPGAGSTPADSATLAQDNNNTGQQVNSLSQNVKDAARPGSSTSMASVDNSQKGGTGSQEAAPQQPIPSPIASRGSLGAFTKHSTAYA